MLPRGEVASGQKRGKQEELRRDRRGAAGDAEAQEMEALDRKAHPKKPRVGQCKR